MGLDVVELVMDLEKRFNIALEDCSLVRVRTVADLAALVISRMSRVPDVCPTATTFYRLRALLVSTFGVERRSFRPGARLADVLPEDARSAWSSIQRFAPGVPPLFRETDGTGVSIDPTVVVFTFFGVGLLMIFLNYTEVLPGSPTQWYLLGGLGAILAGIITATQLR